MFPFKKKIDLVRVRNITKPRMKTNDQSFFLE